ncbi:MAG: hypothetical protein K0S82_29 [Gaiellaceae bacterium]|nr:hypothetical protein [Gaiellaceae bacterium]
MRSESEAPLAHLDHLALRVQRANQAIPVAREELPAQPARVGHEDCEVSAASVALSDQPVSPAQQDPSAPQEHQARAVLAVPRDLPVHPAKDALVLRGLRGQVDLLDPPGVEGRPGRLEVEGRPEGEARPDPQDPQALRVHRDNPYHPS